MEDWDGRPLEGASDNGMNENQAPGTAAPTEAEAEAAAPPTEAAIPEPPSEPEAIGPYTFRPTEAEAVWSVPETSPAVGPASALATSDTGPSTTWPVPAPPPPAVPAAPLQASVSAGPTTMSRIAEELVAWFKTLVSAAVYATLIVTFGFQVARVEGESMAPTLENQDRLIVNKLAYRLAAPQVGDIVMLYYPLDPDKSFVKRVVAEAGDTIRSSAGSVYRNDVLLDDDFIPEEYRSKDSWGPRTVPDGFYFVMGDHRSNSSDSRTWDYVPKKYIIGKVQIRWWPVDHARWF